MSLYNTKFNFTITVAILVARDCAKTTSIRLVK